MGKRRVSGEGGIYQRADGRWCASLEIPHLIGGRRRRVIYGESRKEVADRLRQLQRELDEGTLPLSENPTVAAFLQRWLDDVVAQRNRPRTEQSYRQIVKRHIAPTIGAHRLTKLTEMHVQAMLRQMVQTVSPRTANYARTILRRALNQALKWQMVHRNVAALSEPLREEHRERDYLTVEQARAILAAVKGHRYEVLYRVALSLGLRRGEVLGLRRQDVDLERRTLSVRGALQRIKGQLVWESPKSARSRRTLAIPPALLRVLTEHLREQQEQFPAAPYVFVTTTGTPIEPVNLSAHFRSLALSLGLDVHFHDLRHACATMMIAQGIHPRVIMQTLGHAQISTTMDIYGHVLEESLREAAERVDGLLGEAGEGEA